MLNAIPAVLLSAIVTSGAAVPEPVGQDGPPASDPTLASLTIDIWPEYDDARVLVIYDGVLAFGGTLPLELTFVVPADAQVHMAGGIAANGGHLHADFDTRLRDDGLMEVSYAPQAPRLYMELYYNPLSGDDDRQFTYPVTAPFEVDSLVVRVQEPLRATGFELAPAAEESMQDNKGLDYHVLRRGDLPAGSVMPVTVAYRKTDRQPSVTRQGAPAAVQSGAAKGNADSPWQQARTWILVTLAVGFFGMGFYKMFAKSEFAGVSGASAERTENRRTDTESGSGEPGFCAQCGRPLAPEHRYCGTCGTRVEGR